MKTIITILFFLDTAILIILSFFLLQMIDHGMNGETLTFLLLAYGACIFLMGYLLLRYMKLPAGKKYQSFFD